MAGVQEPPKSTWAGTGADWAMAGGVSSMIEAGCQIVGALYNVFWNDTIANQKKAQDSALNHQSDMADIDTKRQEASIEHQERNLAISEKYQGKVQESEATLAKAKGDVSVADETLKQAKISKEAAKVDERKEAQVFDKRGHYFGGAPADVWDDKYQPTNV